VILLVFSVLRMLCIFGVVHLCVSSSGFISVICAVKTLLRFRCSSLWECSTVYSDEWCRVEQEIMARIVSEMHDRQHCCPAVQLPMRSPDYVSDTSSVASDVQSTSDRVIGRCHTSTKLHHFCDFVCLS